MFRQYSFFENESIFSPKAVAVMAGMKDYIYELGLRAMSHYLRENKIREE